MIAKNKRIRIMKKHIGRSMDFYGCNADADNVCHGRIVDIRNGIATLEDVIFPSANPASGWRCLIECNSPRIIEIY